MKKVLIRISIILIIIICIIMGLSQSHKEEVKVSEEEVEVEQNKQDKQEALFDAYYELAKEKLKTMTLDEKISQLFLVRYPEMNQLEELQKYNFGGYLFFAKDFKNKTEEQVKDEIANLQSVAKIPLLIAADEEGGKVVRVSSNPNLAEKPFESPRDLYISGGFEKVAEDTVNKSKLLNNLGVNLNLAPVVDVSTNPNDYMYQRALGEDTDLTSIYSSTVINASKGLGVSYTLKHFPGYGNNMDTHKGSSVDNKSFEDILKYDLPPFKAGIEAGAEAVLISHNVVTSIDNERPASLSKKIHDLLRDELEFTGVIITDDLDMGAIENEEDSAVKALLAGNDLIIVSNYEEAIASIKLAIEQGRVSEDDIENANLQVLEWKYFKGLM